MLKFYGRTKHNIKFKEVGKGFLAFLVALILCGLIGFFGWKGILKIYPNYLEILQGFSYNGHLYILFFVLLSLSITFYTYKKVYAKNNTKELLIAPITFWIIINFGIAFGLKGASFFIIPLFFTLVMFYFLIKKEYPSIFALCILCLPSIFILTPFIEQLPIALGLKTVVASCVLTVLLFGLLLPVVGFIRRKKSIAHILLIASVIVFIIAHLNSDFNTQNPRPNSLVYFQDNDFQKSYWLSYDNQLDSWNKSYFNEPIKINDKISFSSKYNTGFNYSSNAKNYELKHSTIIKTLDTVIQNERNIVLKVKPNRELNTIDINSANKKIFNIFKINNTNINTKIDSKFFNSSSPRLATYHVVDSIPLELDVKFHKDSIPNIELVEIANDLLSNTSLNIKKRNDYMIPKPFVINDATVVKQTIKLDD